jgi:hypothetical protein
MARQPENRPGEPARVERPPLPHCRLLDQMRDNPKGDWSIRDVETLCRQIGLRCSPPRGGGSHYKVSSQHLDGIVTVIARKPIKPIYIRHLVVMADGHVAAANPGAQNE